MMYVPIVPAPALDIANPQREGAGYSVGCVENLELNDKANNVMQTSILLIIIFIKNVRVGATQALTFKSESRSWTWVGTPFNASGEACGGVMMGDALYLPAAEYGNCHTRAIDYTGRIRILPDPHSSSRRHEALPSPLRDVRPYCSGSRFGYSQSSARGSGSLGRMREKLVIER